MRYYKLTFLPPIPTASNPNPVQSLPTALQQVLVPGIGETRKLSDGTTQGVATYILESTNPSALQVEINCMLGGSGYNPTDLGSNYVQIWGLPTEAIADIAKLNGWIIRVQAGFDKKSLPLGRKLANLTGADNVLIEGQIQFPYGNAIRPELLVVLPIARTVLNEQVQAPVGASAPLFHGKKGERLSDVVARTFSQYYPGIQPEINITDTITLYEDQLHAISSLQDFANLVNVQSKACLRSQYPSYMGVISRFVGDKFVMSDVIAPLGNAPKVIDTIDMIGVPEYVDSQNVHVSCPMRADIRAFDLIQLNTPALVRSLAASTAITALGWPRDLVGVFQVLSVHHVGNSRAPDGTGWATHMLINANPVTPSDYGQPLNSQTPQKTTPQAYGNN
ncbi:MULTISPECIES: hypothetical protein [Burkholderia]|uniref:Baseplate protein J-like domain-containing protein n=2 Tax=Burkholderia multivorans TaxID=87883 RepID=A0AB37ASR2_9BURK|nr:MULTISPECIES: hypothetical protein [Burkholderia]MBG0863101.1 hypothetical protein [Burkholderia sp. 9779_493]MBU9308852.1 hypothetical protein [Burkholderia multivorans]MBU9403494.1 hypothetical protein [Burkholderia multivorans]MBU9690544.1 hypothetical protein [Burkholderia multivorans]MCO1460567.1 hypothetical protein [Burkholderia multivorans]